MTLSLNEADALAKKATRGAGYPWGIAEEAGKAVRWLCRNGVDGCASLGRMLEQLDACDLGDVIPDVSGEVWSARGGPLCPLAAGTALSDMAPALRHGAVTMDALVEPMLVLPFAATAALHLEQAVSVESEDWIAMTDGRHLVSSGPVVRNGVVTIRLNGQFEHPRPQRTRAAPNSRAFEILNRFAHRTYAPATEASRLKGAGAGTSDND